jgi:hypothetical protein
MLPTSLSPKIMSLCPTPSVGFDTSLVVAADALRSYPNSILPAGDLKTTTPASSFTTLPMNNINDSPSWGFVPNYAGGLAPSPALTQLRKLLANLPDLSALGPAARAVRTVQFPSLAPANKQEQGCQKKENTFATGKVSDVKVNDLQELDLEDWSASFSGATTVTTTFDFGF